MVKAVIVFESMFGNTEELARAVAEGLTSAGAEVALREVGHDVPQDFAGCDLLVLAAPTHALSLSRPESRSDAVSRGADRARAATGMREWLAADEETFGPASSRPAVVVFDSRLEKARHWPGSAAKRMAKTLKRQGFTVLDRTSFYVVQMDGPIASGERERARAWGQHLAGLLPDSGAAGPGTGS